MKSLRLLAAAAFACAAALAAAQSTPQASADSTAPPAKKAAPKKKAPPKKTEPKKAAPKKTEPKKAPMAEKVAPGMTRYGNSKDAPVLRDSQGNVIPTSPDAYDVSSATGGKKK